MMCANNKRRRRRADVAYPSAGLCLSLSLMVSSVAVVHSFQSIALLAKPSTNLPATRVGRIGALRATARAEDDKEEGGDEVYDITQNLFPEGRRTPITRVSPSAESSAFASAERSEMNVPNPRWSNRRQQPGDESSGAPSSRGSEKVSDSSRQAASALYQKIQMQRRQKKRQEEAAASASPTSSSPSLSSALPSDGSKTKPEEDSYYDITQSSFPEEERRLYRSSFRTGELSEMNVPNPRWNKRQSRESPDGAAMDIMSRFPEDRPSASVNTGTRKASTTAGSYEESKRATAAAKASGGEGEKGDHAFDLSSNFPQSRPSSLVNTGTSKRDGTITSGSYAESKPLKNPFKRNIVDDDEDDDSSASFDITKQHFGTDRSSFTQHVNSGTSRRRGTASGQSTASSYDEGYRDVAHNFSSDRNALHGHPAPRRASDGKVVDAFRRRRTGQTKGEANGDGEDGYVDKVEFSPSLSPPSPKKSTNAYAVWHKGGSPVPSPSSSVKQKEGEEYLDTPRAFVRDLDMVPSSIAKSVAPWESKGTEADKYFDNNAFSWNLDSTKRKLGGEKQQGGIGRGGSQEQYLDKPRPFQSVNMRESNLSGTKFKRSSDIPPEQKKNIRDRFDDITTGPVSKVDGMGRTRGEKFRSSDGAVFDITRAPMSNPTLQRGSSVVRDATAKARVKDRGQTNGSTAKSVRDRANPPTREKPKVQQQQPRQEEEDEEDDASYDEVMYWLLTHLPNLSEDDAITYFHHLLEEGFDSVDMLKESLSGEDDLFFMKKGHRRALVRSLRSGGDDDVDDEELPESLEAEAEVEPELKVEDKNASSENSTLDGATDVIDDGQVELDEADAWIEEQNRLLEELEAQLAEEEVSASEPPQAGAAEEVQDEEYEDITRSSFVDRPSLASITILPPRGDGRRRVTSSPRPANDGEPEEEAYDITRHAFPDRPSLAAAPGHHEFPSRSERREKLRMSTAMQESTAPLQESMQQQEQPAATSATVEEIPVEDTVPSSLTAARQEDSPATLLAPRAELYQFYMKERGYTNEQAAQMLKDYFTTWTNGAKSHELKFTCVFTCPSTGEHFACGDWRTIHDGEMEAELSEDTYWYSKFLIIKERLHSLFSLKADMRHVFSCPKETKKQAMNAAAARALDCFSFRDTGEAQRCRCRDEPYPSEDDAPTLPTPPSGASLPTELLTL